MTALRAPELTDNQSYIESPGQRRGHARPAHANPVAAIRRALFRRRTRELNPLGGQPVGGVRRSFEFAGEILAPARRVFPLLCPVQEYLWLDDWRAEMVWTERGAAEEGVVFRTRIGAGETWVATRYEPPSAIAYTVFSAPALMVLSIELAESQGGRTELRWRRTFTGLTRPGRRAVAGLDAAAVALDQAVLHERLRHYVETGQPLSRPEALQRVRNGA